MILSNIRLYRWWKGGDWYLWGWTELDGQENMMWINRYVENPLSYYTLIKEEHYA